MQLTFSIKSSIWNTIFQNSELHAKNTCRGNISNFLISLKGNKQTYGNPFIKLQISHTHSNTIGLKGEKSAKWCEFPLQYLQL